MLTTTITFIVVLGFLIFIHEFGHFFAARKIGVKVLEFSIGFPPKLFSKVYGETKYIISWIPLGGYVRLLGQDTEDENPDEPGNYASKSILGRFFILVAGSFMNILTAFILMPLVFFIGYEVPAYLESSPIVGSIKQGSIAEKVGFKKDDLILSVNGENTLTWKEVQEKIQTNQNPLLKLQLLRDKDKLERQITFTELSRAGEMGWKEKIEPIIGKVILDSPADQAGIKKEDLILSINGEEIQDWSQISPLVKKYGEQQLKIKFSRKGKILETTLIPEFSQEGGYWVIGVFSSNKEVSEGFLDSIVLGSERVVF
ncbi:MAG: RIP metalloprotease RseP, partial [Deltaproteobacteria bacterium]|nr:RIP metalloprotease RseP [Deltaproteobacteria bacterium]